MKRCVFGLLFWLLAAQNGIANACSVQSADKITNIYFSNGVWNDVADANAARDILSRAYKSSLESQYSGQTFEFRSAPNQTTGKLSDVIQVLAQKADELGVQDEGLSTYQIFDWIRSGLDENEVRRLISATAGIVAKTQLIGLITNEKLEELSDTLNQATAAALSGRVSVNTNHINEYESQLLSGRRIIIIAHSQGNLFANETVRAVLERNPAQSGSIAIIGVASPAADNLGSNIHITANDDRVIDALRFLGLEPVLNGTVDNMPTSGPDPRPLFGFNHTFLDSYFAVSLPSRGKIDEEVDRLAANLPFPPVIAGEGAIRATLTWGSQPDMDLHAFEPNGSHVYYSRRTGLSGTLDVDDVTSFGPENYFVPCDNAEVGTYRIGVNYFRGDAPETATVALFLGNGQTVSPRSITLSQGIGASGNASPSILFQVSISEPTPGVFAYDVN